MVKAGLGGVGRESTNQLFISRNIKRKLPNKIHGRLSQTEIRKIYLANVVTLIGKILF